ncbi:unnamed protein product [Rotaria sp. Silwood1]|nr:unnamed protein product [Rotaria sp. Silwood1]CAF1607762.1 unnamed protein product [Rotaria sp. Silwood1]
MRDEQIEFEKVCCKKKWSTLVSTYIRTTKRRSIRKIDFPKLLYDLYTSSFSSSAISGGFRRAGILPWDGDAMKDKVVRRASSSNILTMNDSLASSILSSLVNEIRTPNVHTNNSNNSSSTNQMDIDLPPSSYRRQVTFDDESSDESDSDMGMYADSSTKQKPINIHYDSDEHLDSSSNQNNGDLASTSSSTSIQLRHTSAIRTIMSSYVRNNNESVQPKPVKLNRRVRIERKFGEDITNGNLLQELKEKAEAKKAKMKKKEFHKNLNDHPKKQINY